MKTRTMPKRLTCYNCGKLIKGKGYTKIGKYYCCQKCCGRGKQAKFCQFC